MVSGGLGVLGIGVVGVGVGLASARAARRFFRLSLVLARRSSRERLATEGVGEGVGRGSAGFSIKAVEGVGRGVGGVIGVLGRGKGVMGTGWGIGFDSFRLLLGLRCFLVRGLVGVVVVVVGMLEETLSVSVFFAMGLEGGL